MSTRSEPLSRLKRWFHVASLALLCFGPSAHGADFQISIQADFDRHREAVFSPGDNILFERGKTFTGMFAPKAVGVAGNVITITTYGEGPRPVINNNGVIHPHPTRAGASTHSGSVTTADPDGPIR